MARAAAPEDEGQAPPRPAGMEPVRIEFYLAAMMGQILAFALRIGTNTDKNELIIEGFAAGVRVVGWFFAYAVLERVRWDGRTRALALTAGVAALLLNLLVSGGISFPSVAGPLWVAVALALNANDPRPLPAGPWERLSVTVPPPLLAALGLWFVLNVFYPVVSAVNGARQAAENAAAYEKGRGLSGTGGIPGVLGVLSQEKHIREKIIAPLAEAARVDPGNARWPLQLAHWYARLNAMKRPRLGPGGEEADDVRQMRLYLQDAQKLDPQGRQGYWAEYQIRRDIARRFDTRGYAIEEVTRHPAPLAVTLLGGLGAMYSEARQMARETVQEQNALAAQALERYLPNDPNDAPLRAALAEALAGAGEPDRARDQARRALELDRQAPPSPRKLTDRQRATLNALLAEEAPG
jgi:hypothetical protein